jgi:thiamine kinase-like enzyme
MAPVRLDITVPQPAASALEGDELSVGHELLQLLRAVPGWGDAVAAEHVSLRQLGGAMSNHVFRLVHAEAKAPPLLLRLYGSLDDAAGDDSRQLFSRSREVAVASLVADLRLGPHCYVVFVNGRLEQLLDSQPLTSPQMRTRAVSRAIAVAVASFHKRVTPRLAETGDNELWTRLRKWHRLATEVTPAHEALEAAGRAVSELEAECERWEHSGRPGSGVVFAHADLQHLNLLSPSDLSTVTLIDYEYACMAPAAYDIANHWCEWAADYAPDAPGGMLNYPDRYPCHDSRVAFCVDYLTALSAGHDSCPGDLGPADESRVADAIALAAAADRYALASHLLWGFWGVIQARRCSVEWDFLPYANQRFAEHAAHRARLERQHGTMTGTV